MYTLRSYARTVATPTSSNRTGHSYAPGRAELRKSVVRQHSPAAPQQPWGGLGWRVVRS